MKPLFLADEFLLGMLQEIDLPVAVVAMEQVKLAKYTLPDLAEVLNYKEAVEGLRAGRFSCLLMSPRRSPFWDKQRPIISRVWEMRKKIGCDSYSRQYKLPRLALSLDIPLSVVDTTDTFHISEWDHSLLQAAKVYWIRELPIHPYHVLLNTSRRLRRLSNLNRSPLVKNMNRIRPISLGLWDSRQQLIKPAAKRYDIFFAGTDTSPWREHARQLLRQLKSEGQYQVFLPEAPLSREDYYRACTESHLVVSPSGLGWDCYRHYEAGLCGSVPVMNYPSIRRYHPFVEGETGLYYDLEDDGLERCLRKALTDRPRLIEMGQRARDHVLKYHLHSKLLRHMLEEAV